MTEYDSGLYCAIDDKPASDMDCGKKPTATTGCYVAPKDQRKAREAAFELLTLPLWTKRYKLSDRVRLTAAQRFAGCSLAGEYKARETFQKTRNGPWPTLVPITARPTRQSPPVPL